MNYVTAISFAKVINTLVIDMKKIFLLTVFTLTAALSANAQSLDKMQWFNEPESYTIKNGTLEMDVPHKRTTGGLPTMDSRLMTARSSTPLWEESSKQRSK